MSKIERAGSASGAISLTDDAETTQVVAFGSAAGAILIVDSIAGGATSISWYVAAAQGDTPVPLHADGSAVSTAIEADKAYVLPDALFASQYIAGVLDAGTASIRLCVKG